MIHTQKFIYICVFKIYRLAIQGYLLYMHCKVNIRLVTKVIKIVHAWAKK